MSSNEAKIVNSLYIAGSGILSVVGLFGSTIICYIFTRKNSRGVSMFRYLAIGTVINLLML